MATEAKRGCGSRKVGGIYLVSEGQFAPCYKMPVAVEKCPCCGGGIQFFRGFRWINPRALWGGDCVRSGQSPHMLGGVRVRPYYCGTCPFEQEKVGLMWVGAKFYTPESFTEEATRMGVSKRIANIPRDFVVGETWVLLAHKEVIPFEEWVPLKKRKKVEVGQLSVFDEVTGRTLVLKKGRRPAIFHAFRPVRVEKIVTKKLLEEMSEEQKEQDAKRGITYVEVPEDDPDHQGTVYDTPGEATGEDEEREATEDADICDED